MCIPIIGYLDPSSTASHGGRCNNKNSMVKKAKMNVFSYIFKKKIQSLSWSFLFFNSFSSLIDSVSAFNFSILAC